MLSAVALAALTLAAAEQPVVLTEKATLRGHGEEVLQVKFSPDGKRLASGDDRGHVKVWDVARAEVLYGLPAS